MALSLNLSSLDKMLVARPGSRAIWIDAEPDGEAFALILRGDDRIKAGNKPSEAKSEKDRASAVPLLNWNDESAAARRFVLATFPDKDSAETCAVQLTEFYASADDSAAPFSVRYAALGDDARQVIPVLLAMFGAQPTAEQLSRSNIGSYADHLAGKERKPKAPTIGKRDMAALQKLAALAANKDALAQLLASIPAPTTAAPQSAAPDLASQLTSLLSQLSALQTA